MTRAAFGNIEINQKTKHLNTYSLKLMWAMPHSNNILGAALDANALKAFLSGFWAHQSKPLSLSEGTLRLLSFTACDLISPT